METSVSILSFAMIAVCLVIQIIEARDLPSAGLLDEMPKNCSNSDAGFCMERHENYPQEKIDELLSKKYQLTLVHSHEETGERQGVSEDPNDCQKTITYGDIYEIVDQNDNIRIVVQSTKYFRQKIRIEKCVNPGRLIGEIGTEHFDTEELKNNEIFCYEKKLDYSFLVLTRDGEAVESVRSKYGIPVCCSCRIGTN